MGRPKHTLPPVHKTDAVRPRWFFRAQVDVRLGVKIERREKPYYLGYCDEQGKRAAEKERDTICAQLNNRPELIQSQTKFGAVLDSFESTYIPALEANTQESYLSQIRVHIRPAFGAARLCDIDAMAVQRWVNSLPGVKSVPVSVLRSVFERAADWGYTTQRNPAKAVRLPERLPVQERRAFTSQEFLRIRARLQAPLDTAADVAVFCGLRLGEIAALVRRSLDYGEGLIRVDTNVSSGGAVSTPKSGRRRTAPMGWLREDLMRVCPLSAPAQQSVFGRNYEALRSALISAMDGAGVKFLGRGWHCFRRTYATGARESLEMRDVQDQMGHSTPAMTQRYVDEASQARREAAMERMRAAVFFQGEGGRA